MTYTNNNNNMPDIERVAVTLLKCHSVIHPKLVRYVEQIAENPDDTTGIDTATGATFLRWSDDLQYMNTGEVVEVYKHAKSEAHEYAMRDRDYAYLLLVTAVVQFRLDRRAGEVTESGHRLAVEIAEFHTAIVNAWAANLQAEKMLGKA